ncbi:ribosome small subunit-dependent GTPase A [Jiangella aurantiaca]|uniref:Small ribosomal subunit biogenesis GTPase RsgA n=1 Tax=Jiangella aurantiaca TaxID=2530373 RepID=A0A4R5ADA3_9ACTN|nr:ribosome small subunit-dependent GTPase A [Jiangella aurantiaca]TDD69079.1 ribosome small subunit-dependent GTPase A [Jiangella aurantiaca]
MARRTAASSYDEGDVRVRPGRGSRPRSKLRPAHANATSALVIAVDRGRYTCVLDGRTVTAMTARELGRKAVVVGDRVGLVGDVSGAPGSLARIVRVESRSTVLRRTADDDDPVERVIVANADQLMIVTAVADPEPRPRLIDRALVAAFDAGIEPLLCLTKADLADPGPLLATYAPLHVPAVVTRLAPGSDADVGDVERHLRDRVTVLVGHSGVGKSTLVNVLVPGADRAVGQVNVVTGRGRHTSTSAVALPLPDGGWVIDTPGIRSFGLAHVDPDRLILAFPDLAAETEECPRGCTHADGEPECGLDAALAAGRVDPDRLASYRRLLASRDRQAGD